ncbi:MAG: hypothetical protein NTX53_06785 [candidate division WOR-3 bacterium]|nr:hypothetical protein [candidate division WOR-3 bacterium]
MPGKSPGDSQRIGTIRHEPARAFIEVTDPWDAKNTIGTSLGNLLPRAQRED